MKITHILEGRPFQTEFGIIGYSSVVLVQTKEKTILYDCGSRGCSVQLKENLKKQGLTPSDITHVVISHLHFDHVGNLPLFKNAKVLMSFTEWENAISHPDEYHDVAACEYIRRNCSVQFVAEGDVIADAVTVMELPGHTQGLIGLKCGNDTILCSDAMKNRYEMWDKIPPMSVDMERSLASQERIRKEARFIYPGHDCMLDAEHPINKEPVSFLLKFANGTERRI